MPNWLLPENIADVLPSEARKIEDLRRKMLDAFRLYGYELVMPPLLEYVESLLAGAGQDSELRTFKVVDQLSGIDPDHAADYRANGAALQGELRTLDTSYTTGLKTCDRREFITSHAAFGYLAEQYDLTQIGISGLTPDAEPSPARIAAVQQEARDHGVTTIFYETLVSPAVATSIAGDLGLRTDVLDPIEAITPESRGDNYIAVMQSNLAALEKANGCR